MENILNKIKNFFKTVAEKFKSFVKKVADKADDVAQNHGEAIVTGATIVGVGAVVGSYFYWQKRFYTARINAINNKSNMTNEPERMLHFEGNPLKSWDKPYGTFDEFSDDYWAEINPSIQTPVSNIGTLTEKALADSVIPSDSPIKTMFLVLGKPGIEVSAI